MARLLIVDDHRTFVALLEHALSGVGHEVVGQCWRADQVLPAAETGHDVVLLNLDMPSDINTGPLVGFAMTKALVEGDPKEHVLILPLARWDLTRTGQGPVDEPNFAHLVDQLGDDRSP
jgi:DNA-binding NarL/FixJ family response regulator